MLAVCISILALSLWCALIRIILQFSRYRLAKSQKQFIEDLANNPYREETLDVSNTYIITNRGVTEKAFKPGGGGGGAQRLNRIDLYG